MSNWLGQLRGRSTHQPGTWFQLTWLTSSPLLRGNRVGMALSFPPFVLAGVSLWFATRSPELGQGSLLLSAALFLSLAAMIIQVPSYLGRVELTEEHLIVSGRLSGRRGRLVIPREAVAELYFAPLERPPSWLPLLWGLWELVCGIGAASAGWSGGGDVQWYWLAGFAAGLSFFPLMNARWQASMQVVLLYQRSGNKMGLVRAWATPQQANSLVNTLHGRIDWSEPPAQEEE